MNRPGKWVLIGATVSVFTTVHGQVCRDLDADGYEAGHTCLSATDCADRSWRIHPAATEVCDGFDNDCDDLLDFGCDGLCEDPTLYPGQRVLEVEGFPEAIGGGCIARTERGHLVVSSRLVSEIGSPYDAVYYARAHDDDGEPWGPAYRVGVDPEEVPPWERRGEVASGGDIALVAYQDAQTRDAATYRLLVRLIDDMGRPLWNGPIDLSATAPVGFAPWVDQAVVWDGERFAVFWAPAVAQENLLVSFIETDGSATTSIVTSDVDGAGRDINMVSATWTGNAFLVSLRMEGAATDNVFNVKVSQTGGLISSIPLSTTASGRIEMALANDRVALAWPGFPRWVWRVAMVDFDGNLMDPPGIIDFHSESALFSPLNEYVVWTGETFGIAFVVWEQPSDYRWFFISVHPDGTLTPPNAVLLSDAQGIAGLWGLTWNGADFRLFHNSGNNHFLEHRIVCSCQDLDGDNFDACTGFDCDDSDPFVNPLIVEHCQGWIDDDCDGLIDCDDLGDCPGGAGPTDVTDLRWSGSDLIWTAPGGAQSYDLGRGLISDLLRRGDTLQSECAGPEFLGASWTDDGRMPPPGDALWYLVRPEGAPCALGGWEGGDGAGRQVTACR